MQKICQKTKYIHGEGMSKSAKNPRSEILSLVLNAYLLLTTCRTRLAASNHYPLEKLSLRKRSILNFFWQIVISLYIVLCVQLLSKLHVAHQILVLRVHTQTFSFCLDNIHSRLNLLMPFKALGCNIEFELVKASERETLFHCTWS